MQIVKVTRRLYTRGEEKTPCHGARAHEFAEMKIEIRYDSRTGDTHDSSILHDAWESGRFDALQDALWCRGQPLTLSITGTAGNVVSPRWARAEALRYNTEIFEDGSFPIADANAQWGTNFRSAAACARYVLQSDGEYAGLDVHDKVYLGVRRRATKDGTVGRVTGSRERILLGHSFGCLHDEIRAAFPEARGCIAAHLSTMRPGAPEQERAIRKAPNEAKDRAGYGDARYWSSSDAQREYLASLGLHPYQSPEPFMIMGGHPDRNEARPAGEWIVWGKWHYAFRIPEATLAYVHGLWCADQASKASERAA